MPKKTVSSDDSQLFREAIGTVKTVKSDTVALSSQAKPSSRPKPKQADTETGFNNQTNYATESLSLEDILSYTAFGLQKNVLKKLRRGHFGLDAQLDLHGLTSNEAKYQLLHFLQGCVEDGLRCVLIIHGKGYRSPNQRSVLKNGINLWLRQYQDVQAFCSASARNGGAGAVYVLLKLSQKYGEQEDTEY